ncbi:ABC transporter ATP-binding protein [Lactobacillus delbrueckii subsp. bulgaricus]|nr:ABC transporter ATP-binding protein [Lactobacillus delbrueckii subsp. bulgaricus]MBT8840959.1 ABC transporter ATP-binding protein [Lactobacillus delbrueckii subsp. bulgaricus]MBT8862105.1 ABC transporter ATP-binding protein [Lactobacillus delbrueckii subsp. bulgaricus]MBT8863411.1 ABC transporter ATP-binding protein [Lactobacillus delbrueckii subsp. bulgaricus]MBT8864982.1 ABC transporter ATP-binding protein [Lactobacillus delbrueckii subsp. bulgaricus]
MQAELTIDHLTFSYGDREVIRDLSLTLPAGTFSLLIGPTGCGKSTLLKIMAGLYPKYGGQLTSGQVSLGGRSQAMMFQEAGEQFTMATPREEIIFAMENLGKSKTEFADRLKLASEFAEIDSLLDQKIVTMSGGEKQRVALAVLVAMDVDLFLLDEPFASVDPAARRFLIGRLAKLKEQGKTIIITDHLFDDYQGKVDGVYRFKDEQVDLLTKDEQALLLANEPIGLHFPLPENEPAAFVMKNFAIKQGRPLLEQKELSIPKGKVTLITGPNGSGKSSLFKAMTKLLDYQGSLTWEGKEVAKLKERTYFQHVAQIFQNASDQFMAITVKEELALSQKHASPYFTPEVLDQALADLDLADHMDQVVYSLSGGQKKKLEILLMLLSGQEVLLIDEPLSGLDQKSIEQVVQLLQKCQEKSGQTILLISHHFYGISTWCDYHLRLTGRELAFVQD